MIGLIALGLGAADAWSHRERPYCPACEFEALRAEKVGWASPTPMGEHASQLENASLRDGGPRLSYSLHVTEMVSPIRASQDAAALPPLDAISIRPELPTSIKISPSETSE